jgi:hypothetical protein
MTINKLSFVLTGMFVTGAVFFTILLWRSQRIREELQELRESISPTPGIKETT